MKVDEKDFEFYTFFLGLRQGELNEIKKLFQSFPYYKTHKLNIIDKSKAIKNHIESKQRKFYTSWRSYEIDTKYDLNYKEKEELFNQYKSKINIISESKLLFHGQSIDKVLRIQAKKPYVIIMDSDIEFKSNKYLKDMIELCNRYNYGKLAAIGTIFQNAPFHLTLKPEFSPKLLSIFLKGSKDKINWKSLFGTQKILIKLELNYLLGRKIYKTNNNLGRFPRLHPALIIINRKIFNDYNMYFKNLYLDVLNIEKKHETKHRILGDNGASFLYQCALAGKKIINIDMEEYITHMARASVLSKNKSKGWSWFNKDIKDDPLE